MADIIAAAMNDNALEIKADIIDTFMKAKALQIRADILAAFKELNDVIAKFDSKYLGLMTLPAIKHFTPEEVAEIAMDCMEYEDFKGIDFYNRERAFISLFHVETIEHIFWERDLEI